MNFQSLSFLLFLTVTVCACLWAGRKDRRAGQNLLAAACILFCLLGERGRASLLVLLAGITVSVAAGRYLTSGKTEQGRKRVAALAALWHIAVLVAFKYTGFFTGGALSVGWVPIGLSFFTFQQLWLLKELYAGSYRPNTTEDLLLYGLFFPALTSGPILRPSAFFPQLRGEKFLCPDGQDMAAGLYAIAMGTVKKVLLADPLGVMVGNGWAAAADLTAPAAWLVILGYTLQLYLDFSGYCDIATGCARLLGLRLPVNFNSPYRSFSVTEFWKRWHITLTTFLRECLYFPLGGSRKGAVRTCLNILIVFLISGFWHGAGWTFILWGGLHGLAQIVERLWGEKRERLPKVLRWAGTFLFVNLAWVFFRAPDLASAGHVLSAAVCGGGGFMADILSAGVLESEVNAVQTLLPVLSAKIPALTVAALMAVGMAVVLWPKTVLQRMEEFRPRMIHALLCGMLLVWAILSFSGVATFIYSNF